MYANTKVSAASVRDAVQLAGFIRRLLAMLLDGVILGLVMSLLGGILSLVGVSQLQGIGLAIPVIYHWYFWTSNDGQTPGKSVFRIRVISDDGSKISFASALIRAIGYHISALLFGLGFIWAIFDANNQTWHDKLAGTYVVNA